MAWRQKVTDVLADVLRFSIQAAIIVDGIALSVGSVYVISKLVWYSAKYLDRTIFAHPW